MVNHATHRRVDHLRGSQHPAGADEPPRLILVTSVGPAFETVDDIAVVPVTLLGPLAHLIRPRGFGLRLTFRGSRRPPVPMRPNGGADHQMFLVGWCLFR